MQSAASPTPDRRFDFLKDLNQKLSTRDIELPPFPDVYIRILDSINNPDVSIHDVGRIVVSAPDLCVRLLLMANSALLNRAGVKVTDLNIAISRLGLSIVRSATVTLAARGMFSAKLPAEMDKKLNQLRLKSVRVAAFAYVLAQKSRLAPLKDNAMLAGLVHNVGQHYLISRASEFPEMLSDEAMDEWGPSISRALVENWGFSDAITAAVEDAQSDPTHTESNLPGTTELLVAAILLTEALENGAETISWEEYPACRMLNIDENNAGAVIAENSEEVESLVSALG